MSTYGVQTTTHQVGAVAFRLRALIDRQQFDDPLGLAEAIGISSAQWSLFGVLWPAGLALAAEMSAFPVAGKRILELGCGLGLASLVLQERGADITASDHHPLAAEFLAYNAKINGLDAVPFRAVPWGGPNLTLGLFDLIIGGDVLYEQGHPAVLAAFLARHTPDVAEVVLTDPGRGQRGRFTEQMRSAGFTTNDRRIAFVDQRALGHLLTSTRDLVS